MEWYLYLFLIVLGILFLFFLLKSAAPPKWPTDEEVKKTLYNSNQLE